jgi:hypothetical protein
MTFAQQRKVWHSHVSRTPTGHVPILLNGIPAWRIAGRNFKRCFRSLPRCGSQKGLAGLGEAIGGCLMEYGGYNVFTRTWWKPNSAWPGGLEPSPGKRRYLARGVTCERAREICKEWNRAHEPGRLSKKAEFEEAA